MDTESKWEEKRQSKVQELIAAGGKCVIAGGMLGMSGFIMPDGMGIMVNGRGQARIWDQDGRTNGPDERD